MVDHKFTIQMPEIFFWFLFLVSVFGVLNRCHLLVLGKFTQNICHDTRPSGWVFGSQVGVYGNN